MQRGIVAIADQRDVQRVIEAASPEQRAHLLAIATKFLTDRTHDSAKRWRTREERRARRMAIEILVRLESSERGGGRFFRMKRRFQISRQWSAGKASPEVPQPL
jgi:hypothetical protein